MSYIGYAWLTSIFYGLGSLVGKIATKQQIQNPWLYNFVLALVTLLCIIPLALYNGVGMPQEWGSMVLLGLANAVSAVFFILAFFAVELSVLSPLSSVRTPFLALIGVLFFHEQLTALQWYLIGILFLAGIFVHIDERMSFWTFWNRGTLLATAWIFSSVWFNSMIKSASVTNGFWEVSLWSNILGIMFLIPTFPLFRKDLMSTKPILYGGVTVTAIFYTLGFLWSVKAIGQNVGISIAIIALPLAMIFTVLLALIKPNLLEKHTAKVYAIRLLSAAVMVGAAVFLSA